jgi:hypothetical protein
MALTQGARNKIKSIVQAAKKLLMNEFESQLQQYYGIRPDGSCLLVEELTAREASVIETARLLRQRLHYLEEGIAGKDKAPEAVRQLIREQAFTILNRFAAIRMSEERNIIRESVRKGYNSEGFLVYDQLTGGAKTAEQFTRYSWYIGHVFDELAIDLPAVFDRFSPYALLFPSEKVLLELLSIINDENVNIYREAGHQPINLWIEDETIGWVYQYYNSREEISEMREASGAPRNSRELAVRNQFFTPRYVVQFLVDNSLGRQWFEMTQGKTNLVDSCQYLVKQENEIFLQKGEVIPEAKIVGANYVEYRAIKDPREILMLDPACGSMHFGLYCFDLFEQIYIEAWDNHPELFIDLRDKYLRDDFVKRIPKYILRYNIHGVDIDPRAIQIAGLSLWLRAQKSYDKLGLQPAERPAISKSNLVIAEPMPGDVNLLSEFTKSLPGPIGKLVRIIWEKMQLAGETGLLLKIEEELKKEIELAKEEYNEYKNSSAQVSLFDSPAQSKAAEMAAVYGKGQNITKDFFDTAEEEVLNALKGFAENSEGEDAFQKLLFAEDTARGFAFIELCRKRYDVIVMNPPFGAAAEKSKVYIDKLYIFSKADLAACFIDRMLDMRSPIGDMGILSTRTIYFINSFENWRKSIITNNNFIFADFGLGVLDAQVEASAVLYTKKKEKESVFYRIYSEDKEREFFQEILEKNNNTFNFNLTKAKKIPNNPFCYWLNESLIDLFSKSSYKTSQGGVKQGLATADNFRFIRNHFEVISKKWARSLVEGGGKRFYSSFETVVLWDNNGKVIKNFIGLDRKLRSVIRNEENYFSEGLSFPKRSSHFKPHVVPRGTIFSNGRFLAIGKSEDDLLLTLGIWNTTLFDYMLKLSVGNIGGVQFENGLVEKFPFITFKDEVKSEIVKLTKLQFKIILSRYYWSSTCLDFQSNCIVNCISLNKALTSLNKYLKESIDDFNINQKKLNEVVMTALDVNRITKEDLKEMVEIEYHSDVTESFFATLIDILLGSIFFRWDIRIVKNFKQEWIDENIFKAKMHSPFLYGPKESTLNLVLSEYHDEIKKIWEMPYPIDELEKDVSVKDTNSLVTKLKEVIKYFWPETSITIEEELLEHFKVNELSEIIDKHNKFFDAHLKDYTRNKRISPIYWHLGVPSGKFNIWIYYPKLNDGSLFKIVNELVDPKIKEIAKEVEVLEMNGSAKELNDQKEFLAELEDFKEEILRVAQLPYKPNQDDGVLITAAPLHNLFRHSKWKKSTQDCWKALEKGEYDWAHLAYSIWPDRVRKKCVKDLSMAIAHGLENLCEVKAKPKVEKKTKEIKAPSQLKIE